MNKALALFLILAGLVAIIRAADIPVTVGSDADALVFNPKIVNAKLGDNIVFTWAGKIQHSIVQTDAAGSCTKSVSATADLLSGGAFAAPKAWTYTPKAAGKMWYMCGVPGHCAGGMTGTLIVANADGTVPAAAPAAGGAAPGNATSSGSAPAAGASGSAMPMPSGTGAAAPSGSSTPSSANRNYYSIFTSGVVFSSMCMAAAYML